MSKELVISANRHETRVALLEDDQLVEVYFQRANEYSLAGSIHKGRVTRVLPGMQSAFVDLGLERDTFLYVSDFLDENEDIDQVTGDERPAQSVRGGDRSGDRDRDRGDRNRRRDRDRERPPQQSQPALASIPAARGYPVGCVGNRRRSEPWRTVCSNRRSSLKVPPANVPETVATAAEGVVVAAEVEEAGGFRNRNMRLQEMS